MRSPQGPFASFHCPSIVVLLLAVFAAASAEPRVQLVGGELIDWGTVGPSVLKHAVRLANIGTDTLRIKGVWPSCGCTSAPLDKSDIPPGDTGIITISMNMMEYSGEQVKSLTIWTNDPQRGELELELRAVVVRDLAFSPASLPLLREAIVGQVYSAVIDVKNNMLDPVVIYPPAFTAKKNDMQAPDSTLVRFTMTSSYKLSPGEILRVEMIILPTAPGTLFGDILIKTSSDKLPLFKTSLYCSATDVVTVHNSPAAQKKR